MVDTVYMMLSSITATRYYGRHCLHASLTLTHMSVSILFLPAYSELMYSLFVLQLRGGHGGHLVFPAGGAVDIT